MHEVLTAREYAAIAETITLAGNAFINGAFRPAASGKTFDTINPATGKVLAAVAACDSADVDFAVGKAKEAFDDGRWHQLPPNERKTVLLKFAKLLEENSHELAVLESLDSGKPVRECQTIDVPDTIHTIRWHAELIDKIYDSTAPVGANALALVVREPIGVVGCVLPWNFPLLMLAWKIGPALAAGCSVIVKPAEQTSLTTLRVAELAHEAGVPAGVLNIVTGTGKDVGEPIGLHNDVAMVSFTGSTATGRRFLRYPPPQGYYWIGHKGFIADYPHAREVIASVYVPIDDITGMNSEVKDGKTMDQAVKDWTDSHADLIKRWENIKKG